MMEENIRKNSTSKQIQEVFMQLLNFYTTPSFGSVKQREFDIFLFGKLQELGAFDKKNDIYEVVSKLKITRSKARNLIYENNLRNTTSSSLDEQLKEELKNARFLKGNIYLIGIEIENPLLIDHLKAKLKNKGYSSDGSFSPEIVKLSSEAFAALIEDYVDATTQKDIKSKLIKMGYEKDSSFRGLISTFVSSAAKKVAGEAGEIVAGEYITPLIDGTVEKMNEIMKKSEDKDDRE